MESVGHLLRFGFKEETDRTVTQNRIKETVLKPCQYFTVSKLSLDTFCSLTQH